MATQRSRIRQLQRDLNAHGFKGRNGQRLSVDGIVGPQTQAAINNCKDWQSWLNNNGFESGPIDGWPGRRTDGAIRKFQTAAGIRIDGIIGPQTNKARGLWQGMIVNPAPAPPPPVPASITSISSAKLVALNASTQGYNGSPYIAGYSEARRMNDLMLKVNHYAQGKFRTLMCPWRQAMNYNYNVSLIYEGIRAANQNKADFLISFHSDAAGDPPGYTGSLVLYMSQKGKNFGDLIVRPTCEQMNIPYKGSRQKSFLILRKTAMPAIIVEVLNHVDPDDCRLLVDDHWLDQYAQKLVDSIAAYLG